MPKGILVMKWDMRVGIDILASYPDDIEVQERTLLQVYSQHELTGEASLVILYSGGVNLASYYTDPETSIYVILLMTHEENGEAYEEGLVDISRQILTSLDPEPLKKMLPSLFQRLQIYPSLTKEQNLALLYESRVKRMIMERLRHEALLQKSEIIIWLRDVYQAGFFDIESIISSLVKAGLVKVASVKGISSDVVFLNRDLVVFRAPPASFFREPEKRRNIPRIFLNEYKKEIRDFFLDYKVSDEDNANLIEQVMLDTSVYKVMCLLRQSIVTKKELNKLRQKGVDNLERVLSVLWENKMIAVFEDKSKVEHYALINDIKIKKLYPKYNVQTILEQYISKSKHPNTLVRALNIMKSEYYDYLEEQKRKQSNKNGKTGIYEDELMA